MSNVSRNAFWNFFIFLVSVRWPFHFLIVFFFFFFFLCLIFRTLFKIVCDKRGFCFRYLIIVILSIFLLGRNTTHTVAPSQSGGISTNFIIGMTAACAVIFLVALFGNSFGLLVALKKSSSKSTTNLFIANMAVADLLLTFTMMPLSVVLFYRGNLWFGGTLGTVTCKALFYVIPISISASVFTLTFISFDRMYAI